MRGFRSVVFVALAALSGLASGQEAAELFPRPASLEPAVQFWTRVYTEVNTRSGFIHDNLHLDIVYETVRFDDGANSRQRNRVTSRASDHYREILRKLAGGARQNLNKDEQRVLDLFGERASNAEFADAANRVRFQLGQSDRFKAGLVRSGQWKPHIYEVLAEQGLPRELAALPHVESSFDPTAYSSVGAAGMWQFIRSTGLRYMQIDHIVDERRDPYISTHAAARLLADNYSVVSSWPIAITAYNHGLSSMRRAIDQLDTTDIGVIVERYDGRTFGFASRNFYAAFLAALDVDTNAERYFGKLEIDTAPEHVLVAVPDYIDAEALADALGIRRSQLQALNPALMETVWEGDKFVPKGFQIRIADANAEQIARRLDAIPQTVRFAAQRPDVQHRVRSGETLSQIAARYNISVAALVRTNNLRSQNFIVAGQTLNLPVTATNVQTALASAGEPEITATGEYIVRRGDSIDQIARRLGVGMDLLLAANQLDNSNLIYPGQALRVPDETGMTPPVDVEERLPAATVTTVAASSPRDAPIAVRTLAAAASIPEPELEPLGPAIALYPPAPTAEEESDEEDDDAGVLASAQEELAADPSDYTVADNGTIEVQALETLGHYADWLGIRTQRLRDVNGFPFSRAVVIGERIRLDFAEVDKATFEERRTAYQGERQERFFTAYRIEDTTEHVVRRGESLWVLAQRTYDVPVWLLRQYNPDLDLDRVSPGTVVIFPNLRQIVNESATAAD